MIGNKIKEARMLAGLTQQELADKTGINQPHIARYEANGRVPTLDKLIVIAKATNQHPGWFLDDLFVE